MILGYPTSNMALVERSKVNARVKVNSNRAYGVAREFELYECLLGYF